MTNAFGWESPRRGFSRHSLRAAYKRGSHAAFLSDDAVWGGASASGGVALGGSATGSRAFAGASTGGAALGGSATGSSAWPATSTGGAALGGGAAGALGFAATSVGGEAASGIAAPVLTFLGAASGGVALGGVANATLAVELVFFGGAEGDSASAHWGFVLPGELVFEGGAVEVPPYPGLSARHAERTLRLVSSESTLTIDGGSMVLRKQGDTSPDLTFFVARNVENAPVPVDIAGATLALRWRRPSGLLVTRTPVIVDAPRGECRLELTADDTAEEGQHLVELRVTFADGKVETFPGDGYAIVVVTGSEFD